MVTRDFLLVQWVKSTCQYSGHGFSLWSRKFWGREATKPMCHNYWACVPQLLKRMHLAPALYSERSHQNEKPMHHKREQSLLTATRENTMGSHKVQFNQKKIVITFFVRIKKTLVAEEDPRKWWLLLLLLLLWKLLIFLIHNFSKYRDVIQIMGSWLRVPWIEFCFTNLRSVWPWQSFLTCLSCKYLHPYNRNNKYPLHCKTDELIKWDDACNFSSMVLVTNSRHLINVSVLTINLSCMSITDHYSPYTGAAIKNHSGDFSSRWNFTLPVQRVTKIEPWEGS